MFGLFSVLDDVFSGTFPTQGSATGVVCSNKWKSEAGESGS